MRALALALVFATSCHARLAPVATREHATRTRPLSVAILPLVDARDAEDSADGFVYRGVELDHTDLSRLEKSASFELTERLARHLVAARSFAKIVLVDEAPAPSEVDLVLRGKIRRARGYVEAEARADDPKLLVIAEVVLSEIELLGSRGVVASADLGWSIAEDRVAPVDPYVVLSEAMDRTFDQLVTLIDRSELEPLLTSTELARARTSSIAFSSLAVNAPAGFHAQTRRGVPSGWRVDPAAGSCESVLFEAAGRLSFHRALGPFVPSVEVWSCPARNRYVLKGAGATSGPLELVATYVGLTPDRSRVFVLKMGKSAWTRAQEEIARALTLEAPARHALDLPAD
ncbi:MAG: hypothetical protein HYV07_22630 [Deltaproteobacteria bacterium]|nr:hypothetical protein [Deltaproteobacteria bacterium]